ncbi:MAG: ASCH domain-containing protein [Paracoccaceae bacterium]|nr:ASCH domain-containing protein [Paracoccaceae bacterium]
MTDDMEDLKDIYPGVGTFKFGDSAGLCERVNTLVRSGEKTEKCDALANYTTEREAMLKDGRCDIATDWQEVPALVICTISVNKIRFCDIGEETDLPGGVNSNLDVWRENHKALFEQLKLVEDLVDR